MSTNQNQPHRITHNQMEPRSSRWGRHDNALGLDEFGVIRGDDVSKSSDSVPVEDPSLNLTDDDTNAKILEGTEASESESPPTIESKDGVIGNTASESEAILDASITSDLHLAVNDSNAEATAASDDISRLSDSQAKLRRRRTGSPGPLQDETESLTEFEEIERLIQANTVQDSDGDLSDLPIDLEERILSRRTSRESNKSSRNGRKGDSSSDDRRSKVTDDSSHSSSADNSNAGDQTFPKLLPSTHHDTGYGSEANMTQAAPDRMGSGSHQEQSSPPPPPPPDDDDEEDDYPRSQPQEFLDLNQVPESPNSTDPRISQVERVHSTGTLENDAEEDLNEGDVDHFMIPTNRGAVGDSNQPSSLVATFGTTEDFEKLLQQQLEDTGDASDHDMRGTLLSPPTYTSVLQGGDFPQQLSSTRRNPIPTATYRRNPSPSPRNSKNKLKLSSRSSSNSPRDSSRPTTKRSDKPRHSRGAKGVRSPAASRARRANNAAHGRPDPSPLLRESSDDLSVRSDLTRSELRHKLKEEARTRKQDEEFVRELKSNYDDLLMRFAEAENTIDHLRLGAKINLFASVPRPAGESPALPYEEAQVSHQGKHPHQGHTSDMRGGGEPHAVPRSSRLPSAGSDTLVESSLQLPAAASKEFLKVALQLQAKDVQDKIDSFTTLLREAHLSPAEQGQVMGNIEEAMRDLERDYLAAIDQHAAEQRRVCIATGGSIDQAQAFDPERTMEGDLLRLGQRVKNLRNHISAQTEPPPQYPLSSRGQGSREEGEMSYESPPDGDVDERFNELLQQYNRAPPPDDGHTTAPSHIFSSPDDDDERGSPQHVIPNRFLEPPSNSLDSSTVTQDSPRPDVPVQSRKAKSESSFTSLNESAPSTSPSPTRKSNSRLPRPVKSPPNRKSSPTRKSPPTNNGKTERKADKGTDSGFVGSESSRQSAGPVQPAKVKLVPRPSAAVDVKSPPVSTPPRPAERRGRPTSRASTTEASDVSFSPDRHDPTSRPAGYMGRVGIFKPPASYTIDDMTDDVSTTSTVREMLRPPSRSYSTSPPPPSTTKPHVAPFPRGSRTSGSVKSKDSTKRSVASSARDSTLDMIRGEISKLRDEINSAKQQGGRATPLFSSTPRRHPAGKGDGDAKSESDAETLQAIRTDVKALKDEVQRQARRKRGADGSGTYSAGGDSTARQSRSDKEGSTRGRRSRRSRSLGRDDFSDVDGNRKSYDTGGRGRSRSQERRGPWAGGYWTYVPPSAPLWGSVSAPIGRTYTRVASPAPTVVAPPSPTVYSAPPVVHTAPIIGPPSNVIYVEPQTPSQNRVYLQTAPRTPRVYTPSKPQASVYISPRGSSGQRMRKANVYIVESDEEEPLRRSHLSSGLRRSSSTSRLHREPVIALADSRLNDSIDRAERSADQLRRQTRSMYRSVRDNVYRAQLLADTL